MPDLLVTSRISLRALGKNKLRAGLTILGVVIGIAAVTTIISVGQSASRLVSKEFETAGTNVLVVMPVSQNRHGVRQGLEPSLTGEDSDAIADQCGSVFASTPLVGTSGQVVYGHNNWSPKEILGVGKDYPTVRNWEIRYGGYFTEQDVISGAKICVVGHTIVAKLFQTMNPVGRTLRIKRVPFRVVGVLEKKGASMTGEDQDDVVLVPYTSMRRQLERSNFNSVHAILASARSGDTMWQAEQEIRRLLLERHDIAPGQKADFEVYNMAQIAQVFEGIMGTITLLLSAIAGISLLVGGVGIMNVMLVSVTQRTREIGIRMSVGARPRDILCQFLVEAVLLSCIGGLLGFVIGVAASVGAIAAINSFTGGTAWPVVISLPTALIAFLFAAAVGTTFGFYPAWKASRMDPIEALRFE
jgi:putative ABC transport system permease protein